MPVPSETQAQQRLLELLEARIDDIVAVMVERAETIYAAEADHEPISHDELLAATGALARVALGALVAQRPATPEELAQAALIGERRARQGIKLETLLRGFRIAGRAALEATQDLAKLVDVDAPTTIDLVAALWDWIDDVSVAVADGHRRVELALARRDQQERTAFVHGLIRGTLTPQLIAAGVTAFRLDPDGEHLVARARPSAEHSAEDLERLLRPSAWSAGLAAVVDEDLVAILPALPAVDPPVATGVGPAVPLGGLPRSYRLAGTALATALAFDLTGWQRIEDLALRSAVVADDELGPILLARHIAPVRSLGQFGDELLHSLRTYMANGQSIEATAQELFVHPNTLRHRLARFEEVTGTDLRRLDQLAEIWWALTRDELEQGR